MITFNFARQIKDWELAPRTRGPANGNDYRRRFRVIDGGKDENE